MKKVYPDADAALDGLLKDGMHIAAGGFGQNKEMVAFYRPTFKGMTSSNNVTTTGTRSMAIS